MHYWNKTLCASSQLNTKQDKWDQWLKTRKRTSVFLILNSYVLVSVSGKLFFFFIFYFVQKCDNREPTFNEHVFLYHRHP